MLSPNKIANSITGTNDTIGTPLSTPSRLAPNPIWKTPTTTPYAAATDSRLKTAETSGIQSERKAMISSSTDSPITTEMNTGSPAATLSEKSSNPAVLPPT